MSVYSRWSSVPSWGVWWVAVLLALAAAAGLHRPAQAAPTTPALQGPVQGAVTTGITAPPVGVPMLSWEPVPGATRYQVQVSSSAGFADSPVDQTTYATTYTPIIALADGVYYWRVRAEVEREWREWSEIWSFTKDWSAEGSLKPQLLAPADDPQGLAPLAAFGPDHFSWEPVPGAASYLFEIGTTPLFSAAVYCATTLAPPHTPTAGSQCGRSWLANGPYYWHVTPVDAQGNHGAPSDTRAFRFDWSQKPVPLAPITEDGTPAILAFVPRFAWTAVEGAASYVLEISTDEYFKSVTAYTTHQTDYTPVKALANDQDYYWRVKAFHPNGTSSLYSDTRRFRIAWHFAPRLLTPSNGAIKLAYPFFSWEPVPGVERYEIQISTTNAFDYLIGKAEVYNATFYTQPEWKKVYFDGDYYWRVRAIDAQDNLSPWSTIYSFQVATSTTPSLVYPPTYFPPDSANLPVHTDRTVAWPVFVWDTAQSFDYTKWELDFARPQVYSLTVSADPSFQTIDFAIATTGIAAAPTADHPFHFQDGALYYWRVRALYADGQRGSEQTGITRLDRNHPELPWSDTVTLLSPANGFEAVGDAPVLSWLPVPNAAGYRVEIAHDEAFSQMFEAVVAQYPHYVPGQARITPLPYGVYWWRVRALDAQGAALGEWGPVMRFHLSQDVLFTNSFRSTAPFPQNIPDFIPPVTSLLDTNPGLRYDPALTLVATSPTAAAAPFDLDRLHVTVDRAYTAYRTGAPSLRWAIAFQTPQTVTGSVLYALYVDADHRKDSGGSLDPRGKPITVDPLHRPEYVFYVRRSGDTVNAAAVEYYRWNGAYWDAMQSLANISGDAFYDPVTQAVQLLIPFTAVGSSADDFSGSLALTVFSTGDQSASGMIDSLPVQPQPGTINRPAFVSDMLMPLFPFDTPLSNPQVYHELPALRWRMPYYDSIDGYIVEVARDSRFTDKVETWETFESGTWSFYSLMPAGFHPIQAYEDNESYYWRVQVRHERYTRYPDDYDVGAWSPPMRFKLTSYQVGHPGTSPSTSSGEPAAATPTFQWERVEGAAGYTIVIDNDANLGSPLVDKDVDGTSFTPPDALADGAYYWSVATRRSDKVMGQWSPVLSFTKRTLTPTPLSPVADTIIHTQPTFSWRAVMTNTTRLDGLRLAAPRYRLQWDDDPNFGSPATVEIEATAYTLVKGQSLEDGDWYWRVATVDGRGNVGAYSPTQTFYKEYLPPTLVHPDQGSKPDLLYFEWTPLAGAASYEVELDDNDAFSSPLRGLTDNARFTPTGVLDAAAYYWRVRMVDKERNPGPFILGRFDQGTDPGPSSPLYVPLILAR